MAGAQVAIKYIDEDTSVAYAISVPSWVKDLTGDAAATTEGPPPAGFRPRRRFIMHTSDGKERSIVVGDATKTAWSAGLYSAVTGTVFYNGTTATTGFVWAGKRGGRVKHRR